MWFGDVAQRGAPLDVAEGGGERVAARALEANVSGPIEKTLYRLAWRPSSVPIGYSTPSRQRVSSHLEACRGMVYLLK